VSCTIKHNIVHQIGYSGIEIQAADGQRCSPLLRNNRRHENTLAGIGCLSGAQPVIVGNHCFRNHAVGIGFDDTQFSHAMVVNNRVTDNDKVAVGIHFEGKTESEGVNVNGGQAVVEKTRISNPRPANRP
jgi:hypothetical protein